MGFFRRVRMTSLRLAILYSTAGAYGALGRDCRDGAELAVRHLREEGAVAFPIETVIAEPGGNSERYMALAGVMMREGCRRWYGDLAGPQGRHPDRREA